MPHPKRWHGEQTGLGRVVSTPDARDKQFALPERTNAAKAVTSKYWLSLGEALDQGNTSQCVAYSGVRYLTTHPVINTAPDPKGLYDQCQKLDAWPGEDYDGTSVRALMKAFKLRGFVDKYQWAFSVEAIITHVLTRGPAVVGTTWHWEMFTPDRWGYIWPKGGEVGGHAWLLIGVNRKRKNPDGSLGAFRMMNSWGKGWGQNGRAWITFHAMQLLLEDYGEAATANEVKRNPGR